MDLKESARTVRNRSALQDSACQDGSDVSRAAFPPHIRTMSRDYEPGSKDEVYEEIRRRLLRSQNRDRIDAYDGAMRSVRESITKTTEIIGDILGSRRAQVLAAALTIFFAGTALFMTLNSDRPRSGPQSLPVAADHVPEPPRIAGD